MPQIKMEEINQQLKTLIEKQKNLRNTFQPLFFRLKDQDDKNKFRALLATPGIKVNDTLFDQLKELIKIFTPSKKYTQEELELEVNKYISPTSITDYGVWVYYPWSNRLVHIPDEEEFIEIRTSRNQYKITKEERDILRTKKIGVIGLSVGQSVSVTLAMERICGELRLADFDTLELNNLNRIRTGIHNLDEFKVYTVAREIAEIDPFIKIKCYKEGVKEENLDEFFTAGGKLDLLVEESDGFDIKVISRYKARELKIPVIMEASDRCLVDVERFDLEPDRSILHGLIDHLKIETLKQLKTNEEKIPYMLDILGLETSSLRLKASMLEIEQSINTWPQLASAVTMGGGITADVSRRLLLNSYTESGRYQVDIEEIIGNKDVPTSIEIEETEYPELSISEIKNAIDLYQPANKGSHIIPTELSLNWINDGITAPSAGNNQPWKWYVTGQRIFLFHDKQKSTGWTDPLDHLAQIALGAAIENIKLSAAHSGYETNVNYLPVKNNKVLIATLDFIPVKKEMGIVDSQLYSSIGKRCSNRKKGNKAKIDPLLIENLRKSLDSDSDLVIIEDPNQINSIAEIVSTVEMLRFLHPEGHKEFFKKEIRWTEDEVNKTKDGLDIQTLELSFLDQTGLKVASEASVMAQVREWKGGGGLKKISRESIKTSSAIGLVRIKYKGEDAFIKGGQSMQRVWLAANANGLSLHPISSPIFFFERISVLNDLPEDMVELLKQQQKNFIDIIPNTPDKTNLFLFRLSIADGPTKVSLRRDLKDCTIIEE